MTETRRPHELLALALGLYLVAVQAAAQDATSARQLINTMNHAARTLNYDGVFVYHYGDTMETMRIIHKVDADGEHEKLVSLTGSPREVIRNNDSVTCIFPDGRAVLVERSRSRKLVFQLPQPIETVEELYRFSTAGMARVAGRKASIVNITPADEYRYGYRLWIDQDSRLLLKSELLSRSGRVLEKIIFTQLEVHEHIPDKLLEPSLQGSDFTWYESGDPVQRQSAAGEKDWQVSWQPPGFKMKEYNRQVKTAAGKAVEHIIYTDGIAIVSVFIEKLDSTGARSVGAEKVGGVSTYSRQMDDYQITAVGDVPRQTIERMANSVVAMN